MRWLVAGLVLLLALLVAADRAAEQVTERVVARQLRGELGATPQVEFDGLFLPQAVRGRFGRVRVQADAVRREGLPVREFSASLSGLRVAAADAVRGEVDRVPVEQLRGRAVLAYDDLERLSGARGLQLSGSAGRLRLSGPVAVFGLEGTATALSEVRLEGDQLVVRAEELAVDGEQVPDEVARALRGELDLRLPVPPLPYDLRLDDLDVTAAGIAVSGSARDVVLRR